MPGLITEMAKEARNTIDIGDVTWHIRRVRSRELITAQVGMLMMIGTDPTNGEFSKLTKWDIAQRLGSEGVEKKQHLTEGVVIAGVIGVEGKGYPFESLQLMQNEEQEDPAQGRMWVGSITTATIAELFVAITALTTKGGAVLDVVNSFRDGESGSDSADSGEDSQDVPSQPDGGP